MSNIRVVSLIGQVLHKTNPQVYGDVVVTNESVCIVFDDRPRDPFSQRSMIKILEFFSNL